ncbi:3'(2'), 5'-bisphosphate nucleotidase [Xanthobacter flavus]|uniref:3'(2'),5'-bisphosphate nucleotidase CysQ n=1 Tax=Xanthobacter flavus TaxID=281 RepID=A0A9W6CNU6_XANFL|nr:3'(2'),5'-bisphosphate nucleotidase CysQ [Xanthobacter flavus]MDR6334642.1 3'(2'), 5'-bisphosphate nucleotidase [Xanthobacter flavus]GLI23337.1 3'(2'),5'-bisphosphate nucleotidase CysQ [Xanthobacter flavus]
MNQRPPRSPAPTDAAILAGLAEAALEAGVAIRRIEAEGIDPSHKADLSPVTAADHAAEAIICDALARILPGVPVVAEEAMALGAQVNCGNRFVLVDPLDGTKEFISGNGEYTVNIALVEDGTPVLGIVYAPARALLFAGRPGAAFRAIRAPGAAVDAQDWTPIACRAVPEGPIVVAASRSHGDPATDALIGRYKVAERIPAGSALKFGLLAEGKVDLYPRLGTVMEWDSAAGHALVAAAGGSVTRPDGSPLTYGHAETGYKVHGFIAWGAGGLARASTAD